MEPPKSYKSAGVDTKAGQDFVQSIKSKVASTFSTNVLGGLGGFAALYDVSFLKEFKCPVLLSGTDGVGTKLEIARLIQDYSTVGIDLVAMCVNDILVSGGKPLFFQDYIACGRLDIQKMDSIVSGIVEGCHRAECSLVGGETAEHPGVMEPDEIDLAGFVVGVIEKENLINGFSIQKGDLVLGLKSSGAHSNGYSWIRKLLIPDGILPQSKSDLNFLKNEVMAPTRIYVKLIQSLLANCKVKGMVHLTGGGYFENIPRVLPQGIGVKLERAKIPTPHLFHKLKKDHQLDELEMFHTFNMGIGYILIADEYDSNHILKYLKELGEEAHFLGVCTDTGKIEIQ